MSPAASPESRPIPAPAVPVTGAEGASARLRERLRSGPAVPLAVAVLAFLVTSPALLNGFVEWDDYVNLFENARFRGLGWTQLRWMFTTTLMGHYIPVTWLTFGLDYSLWGMDPTGYHLTNCLLHAANAALFYLVARRLLGAATRFTEATLTGAAAVAAAFFALHPLRAESVAWATERRDVLSGFFFLLAVLLYLRAVGSEGRRRSALAASVGCFGLALLSKSIVMTLPLVLLLLDVYPLGRLRLHRGVWRDADARAVLREKAPYALLGLAGALVAYWAVSSNDFLTPIDKHGWSGRVAIAAYSLWFYVEKTVLPVALGPLYELPIVVNPLEPRFLLSAAAVAAITGLLVAGRRRWPAGLAVWAYYGIVLAPVSGLIHAGHQLAHDRYSYLSCLGWALLVGAAAGAIARAGATRAVKPWLAKAAVGALGAWALTLAVLTWYQVQIWRDTETLWRYAVEHDPRCSICQSNLGLALYRQGLFEDARHRFERALTLRPGHVRWETNVGLALQGQGRFDAAIERFQRALARHPDDPDILTNLAVSYLSQKRHAEAIPILEGAARRDPGFFPARVNLGIALVETGRPREGLAILREAEALKPDDPVLRFDLARAHLSLGDYAAARLEYDRLLATDPRRARALEPAFSTLW